MVKVFKLSSLVLGLIYRQKNLWCGHLVCAKSEHEEEKPLIRQTDRQTDRQTA
ncbi:hypothetical protein DPMN_043876 [Dreissena polymorpha]|uniref:Uncharacterized protein n=1 Tax=Dreissena polymorpha TaxID=45954 RepID=A0A9D4D1E1_DREPO|nr:hypothetical protein DPMN_043876 [Dreissena polymorpha]